MKVTLKYRTERGGYKFVKCPCCNSKRYFPSFKKAQDYATEAGWTRWTASRV